LLKPFWLRLLLVVALEKFGLCAPPPKHSLPEAEAMALTRAAFEDFLGQGTDLVHPNIAKHLTDKMGIESVSDFSCMWTSSDYENGLRDDIVAQVEPFSSDMATAASRLQVARLRTLWMKAQKEFEPTSDEGEKGIKYTYFDVEGGGECVRLAFALGNVAYIDDRIDMAKSWKEMKPKMKFTQLPVLTVDGGKQIAQSGAHLRFAGKLAGLIPDDPVEMMKAEEVIGVSWDLVTAITPSMQLDRRPQLYGWEGTQQEELTKIAVRLRNGLSSENGDINRFLGYLDKMLADNGTGWFVGTAPTIAECEVVPRIRSLRKGNRDGFPKDIVDKFSNLMKMYYAFHELPAIKAHYKGVPPY